MDEFILIFRHQDGKKAGSPEQIETWLTQTQVWMNSIANQDKLIGGNGLRFDESRVVKPKNVVLIEPFGNINETIGGYVIVKAESVDEAVEFAKGCPVLQGDDNSVEVRKVARNNGFH